MGRDLLLVHLLPDRICENNCTNIWCSLCIDIGTHAFRVFEEASTSTTAASTFHQKKKPPKAEKNERLGVRDCVHTRPMIDDREWKLNGIDRMHSNTTFGTYGVQVFMRRP